MKINGKTELLGLVGWPVSHSFSPAMHNAAAKALGLDLVYVPLAVPPEGLAAAVSGLRALGFKGVNVTVPHKEAVVPLLDEVDAAAQALGAVNTIVMRPTPDGPLPLTGGYNTDWSGFLADLDAKGVDPAGQSCLILGAGGSARAVAYGLAVSGGQVHLLARRPAQAQQLVADLAPHPPAGTLQAHALVELPKLIQARPPSLIVNTTPLGMTPHEEATPWPSELPLPTAAFVYDLVYSSQETTLMRQAQTAGCRTANGLGMLLQQGAAAFRLWTGHDPDLTVMAQALQENAGRV